MAIQSMDAAQKVAGGQRSAYPAASEMPEVTTTEAQGAGADMGGEGAANPVIDALKILTQFVLAAEQKGLPQAAAMKAALAEFVRSVSSGSSAAGAEETAQKPTPAAQPEPEAIEEQGEGTEMQATEAATPQGEAPVEGEEMPPNPQMRQQMMKRKRRAEPISSIQPLV